jgi:hypothetical protein
MRTGATQNKPRPQSTGVRNNAGDTALQRYDGMCSTRPTGEAHEWPSVPTGGVPGRDDERMSISLLLTRRRLASIICQSTSEAPRSRTELYGMLHTVCIIQHGSP